MGRPWELAQEQSPPVHIESQMGDESWDVVMRR